MHAFSFRAEGWKRKKKKTRIGNCQSPRFTSVFARRSHRIRRVRQKQQQRRQCQVARGPLLPVIVKWFGNKSERTKGERTECDFRLRRGRGCCCCCLGCNDRPLPVVPVVDSQARATRQEFIDNSLLQSSSEIDCAN